MAYVQMLRCSIHKGLAMQNLDRPLSRDAPPLLALISNASGSMLEVRPSAPVDYRKVADHLNSLSLEDRACRFLAPITISPMVIESFLDRTDKRVTFLAVDVLEKVAGMATLVATREPAHAEVAISVSKPYRRQGVGSALLDHVVRVATDRDLAILEAVTSAQNQPLQHLAARAGSAQCPFRRIEP